MKILFISINGMGETKAAIQLAPDIRLTRTDPNLGNGVLVVTQWK